MVKNLREVFSTCRSFFIFAGIFSFFTKLLALSPVLFMMTLFHQVLESRSVETLIVITGVFLFATVIDASLDALCTQLFIRFGDTVYVRLRGEVLNAVLKVRKQGGIDNHGLDDLDTIRSYLSGAGIKAVFEIPWIPIFIFVLWLFHPYLAILAIISALILFGLTFLEDLVAADKQVRAGLKSRQSNDFINHTCQNAEVVAALSMQGNIQKRWETLNNEYMSDSFAAKRRTGGIVAVSKFVRSALHLVAMGTAAYLVISDKGVSSGVILASTILMGKTLGPIIQVLSSWRSFVSFRSAYKRLDTLLKNSQGLEKGFRNLPPVGQLAVENILFFLDKDRTILRGVNFKLDEGEVLGVVGASASGKTSLAKLMVGIYQPSDGVIRLDGIDVFQWSQNGLGEFIGYLPQDLQLFKGTVAENIARMGDAYQHVEAVVEAAKRARVHDMIVRLPKGYDTDIGESGKILSGGQRRQIGLARALFGRPRFVVLDEPNSNLDGRSELVLLEVIRGLKADGVTVVIIGHKPSLLQDVDKMLVLGQGKQLMFGPREEIMKQLGEVSEIGGVSERARKGVLTKV
jgi:PrtD family type I secretion system ABC transporter